MAGDKETKMNPTAGILFGSARKSPWTSYDRSIFTSRVNKGSVQGTIPLDRVTFILHKRRTGGLGQEIY